MSSNGLDLIKSIRNMIVENDIAVPQSVYDFLEELTPDDVGREVFKGGWVLRFEGFTDQCIDDVLGRLNLPKNNANYLEHFEDVYNEVLSEWKKEEGLEPIEWSFVGDKEHPIQYAIFYKGN